MGFLEVFILVQALLQREGRITYRALKHIFSAEDSLLDDVRRELIFKRLAIDEEGEGLVWMGAGLTAEALVPTQLQASTDVDAVGVIPETSEPHPSLSAISTSPVNRPASNVMKEEVRTSESVPFTPAAERRQLTVMFCDLVGSTDLSGCLDPEDLREVVRAYQETAAEVIERFEGHIAQYLGDGLLVYFGWPLAHEDDAQRGVHTGLGIVDAMASLKHRLERDYGVQLAVRLGLHTGPVVVGPNGWRRST